MSLSVEHHYGLSLVSHPSHLRIAWRGYVDARQCEGLRQWRDDNGATDWAQLGFLHIRTKFFNLNSSYDPEAKVIEN